MILNFSGLGNFSNMLKKSGKKIVLTAGVFDLMHIGHAVYIRDCAALGDILIVGVNSDELVTKMKGDGRPIISEKNRADLISFLKGVDYVVIFSDIKKLICEVRPDVLVISETTQASRNQEKRLISAELGIKVVEFGNSHPDVSTSQIIAKIKAS